MKFISYLNMHRSRLGYVNCVLMVADTQLDSPVALRRRLDDLLFRPVFQDDAMFARFEHLLIDSALQNLEKQATKRSTRRARRSRTGVVAESTRALGSRAYDVSELWLLQKSMRSHVGKVLREDSDEPIELAKDLGLLSSGYALTQLGHMLKLFIRERTGEVQEPVPDVNPLLIYDDIHLRLLYLYVLLDVDIVFAAMLVELSTECEFDFALRRALDRLVGSVDANPRLDEITEAKGIFKLRDRIQKVRATAGGTAIETPVDKAQRVPRLEFCVDLGLLDREDAKLRRDDGGGTYRPTPSLQRVSLALRGFIDHPGATSRWLDREFFGAAGLIYDQQLKPITDPDLQLLYFARGCTFVKGRVGFIPGRVAAIVACLLAWLDGWRLEIANVFDSVYRVPKSKWADYVKFSGGSRLDNEFLVVVESSFEAKLLEVIRASNKN